MDKLINTIAKPVSTIAIGVFLCGLTFSSCQSSSTEQEITSAAKIEQTSSSNKMAMTSSKESALKGDGGKELNAGDEYEEKMALKKLQAAKLAKQEASIIKFRKKGESIEDLAKRGAELTDEERLAVKQAMVKKAARTTKSEALARKTKPLKEARTPLFEDRKLSKEEQTTEQEILKQKNAELKAKIKAETANMSSRNSVKINPSTSSIAQKGGTAAKTVKSNSLTSFFDNANGFLSKYISNGKVAYSQIKSSPDPLNSLVAEIEKADLSTVSSIQKQAFYINAYNLLTINSIVKKGIPGSPLDVPDFFKKAEHVVAGQKVSLDNIEKKLLFGLKNDPRFHFVVVCGAIGCPQIEPFAYHSGKLESQLQSQTQKAINNDNFIRVNDSKKVVEISKIFEWYAGDFGGADNILSFINKYRKEAIPADYTVAYYEYDWKLNAK